MIRRNTVLLATALSLAGFTLLAAQPEKQSPTQSASADAARIADPEGMTYTASRAIVRDEKTGSLRKPTGQETADLVRSLKTLTNRSTANLQVKSTSSGMQKMDLQGGFAMVMLARPNEEGGTEMLCVSTFEEAAGFLGLKAVLNSNDQAKTGVSNAN